MRRRHTLPRLVVIFILLSLISFAGCGPGEPAPTLTPTIAPTATHPPPPTFTPTPVPPRAGVWEIAAPPLGTFTFEVAPGSADVKLTQVTFTQYQCQGYGLDGTWEPLNHSGPISAGRFALSGPPLGVLHLAFSFPPGGGSAAGLVVSFGGYFDPRGTGAAGTWQVAWGDTSCSGDWLSGTVSQVPTVEVQPTVSNPPTPPPSLGKFDGVVYVDDFATDNGYWYTGDLTDDYVASNRLIVGGKFRWNYQALQPSRLTGVLYVPEVVDFQLSVDAQAADMPANAAYGLLFRRYDRSNAYFFLVKNEGQFAVFRVVQDQWTALIDWTANDAIRPGAVNTLAVEGVGNRFAFYINGQGVGQVSDRTYPYGFVGLIAMLDKTGDQGTFLFDNFSLNQALCANGIPAGKGRINIIKDSAGERTINFNGEDVTIHSGTNSFDVLADLSYAIVIDTNTTNISAPACGENTIRIP